MQMPMTMHNGWEWKTEVRGTISIQIAFYHEVDATIYDVSNEIKEAEIN